MQILRVEDPRDSLSKASRIQLCTLAKHFGISEIGYGKDQTLEEIVKILLQHGVHDIKIPDKPLGIYQPLLIKPEDVIPLGAKAPVKDSKLPSEMNMTEMRSECKRRGIKMARTDNLNTLREKLSA